MRLAAVGWTCGLAGLALGAPAAAQDLSAQQIVDRMLDRDLFGWQGAEIEMRMVLRTRGGEVRERAIQSISKIDGPVVRTVIRFRSPAEVAGTSFLLVQPRAGGTGPTEQHIYLPALHRTRRIVGSERHGRFMGSDFTYADMESRGFREGRPRKLPDESLGGRDCWVIELTPADADSDYGRLKIWVLKESLLVLKIEFADRQGALVKTLLVRRVRTIDGRPVAVESTMTTHASGHVTEMHIDSLRFRSDLPADAFTTQALERG